MRGLLLSLLLTACGPVDLVVVDVPDGGYTASSQGLQCSNDDGCKKNTEFCEFPFCGATEGTCVARTELAGCEALLAPQCGCDGITYANECMRRSARVSRNSSGPGGGRCEGPDAKRCGPGMPCPTGAFCNAEIRRNDVCGDLPARTCWVVPETCTSIGFTISARLCVQGACTDICSAVRSEQPYQPIFDSCP